ncbi:MAG: hypothetical protein JXB39_06495, partial [Deltaproteobacteria bacterium]|nr:hypothetical protein [Deltaproteobacteria bacterium]
MRGRPRRWLAVLAGLAGGLAAGEARAEPPWWMGQTVGMVSLEATDGGLPGENLEPLLNIRQGGALSPRDVRADLAMLQEVGDFAAVEAHVEAWVTQDDEGNPVPAVRLVYLVVPPPRVRRVQVERSEALSRREVLSISGLARGDPFFPNQAVPATEARIGSWLAKHGWPSAEVGVEVIPVEGRQVDVRIAVDPGRPQQLASVTVRRMPQGLKRKADRVLRKVGLRQGDPFTRDAMVAGREALLDLLEAEGYPEARVRDVLQPTGEGSVDREVVYVVEPRRRVTVEIRGLGGNRKQTRREVARTLGHRISDEIVEEAEHRIARDLADQGWYAADVEIQAEDRPGVRALLVSVDRGQRHKLEEVRFSGATAFSGPYLEEAMREADPEVLGRGWVTPEALDRALGSLAEFYRSQGFLSARLERTSIQRFERKSGSVPVVVEVAVREGPRTWLSSVTVENDPGPAVGILDDRVGDLLGQPLNPAATDALAREIGTACWEEGFLSADVAVVRDLSPDASAATVRFVVTPGPRVVLRNVLVQGLRHTRRSVVEKETRLETGE